jgi:uncharacterized protein GlcG (DUF336 family)
MVAKRSASRGQPPEGDLVAPAAGSLGGLSATDVQQILNNAEATAQQTTTLIRLPLGSKARMMIAVANLDGTIIGLRRMTDSTAFRIDVAVTKARNMVYFNSSSRTAADLNQVPSGTAVTNRTSGFGAQPFFPPGIDGSAPGHFSICTSRMWRIPARKDSRREHRIPTKVALCSSRGSLWLYRNGTLVGGLGVSGDGVDQDDYVTVGGAAGFEAPAQIRVDPILINGVRLPYQKFPRNPIN